MITVMGATGQTGSKITEKLLKASEKVLALGRSVPKLETMKDLGADVLVGDVADVGFLTKAFRGADAVYTLLPPDRQLSDYQANQQEKGEAMVKAIRESGVRFVVFLSSLGADLSQGTGLLTSLFAQEERLRQLENINILILRPTSFFENFYDTLEFIKNQEIIGDSIAPDLAMPMVATQDIARVGVRSLRARDWKGVVVRELLGPRDLTYVEATRILGKRIGKPNLGYVQFSDIEMVQGLVQSGLSESFARHYVEMTQAFNEGKIIPNAGRTSENTTPTQFEDFVDELAPAFQSIGD
ncbi:NmrA family NAD(P)-binding protein [Nitrospira sp. M1]